MYTLFESTSNRVKGLSFHSSRPWILVSLHNGTIQLYDYRMKTLLYKWVNEHEGPVRGLNFHSTQPLFVSGGDDQCIKVWNYISKSCLYTLTGHLDYIRTTEFHHEYPWILSASDDQTIRIWNWQSRQCVTVLTGHNHYVMSAKWHPKLDLVVSASLDDTIRVWDVSGLRKKTVSISNANQAPSSDLWSGGDVSVKHVFTGHSRGVNWATFHPNPNKNIIASGADDRDIRLWKMTEGRGYELETFRGHTDNVSCVLFSSRSEILLSVSEDRSFRVWDLTQKRPYPKVWRREKDRYWILASHPNLNLFAAGHDSGMFIFKLNRERPIYTTFQSLTAYYQDDTISIFDVKNNQRNNINSPKPSGEIASIDFNASNPNEYYFLLTSIGENSENNYSLRSYPKVRDFSDYTPPLNGTADFVAFISRNRFASYNKSIRQISLKNMKNEVKKKIELPNFQNIQIPDCNLNINNHNTEIIAMHSAGISRLLFITNNNILLLFDIQSKSVVSSIYLNLPSKQNIKYIKYNSNYKYLAVSSKSSLIILDANLKEIVSISELIRIKSMIWDNTTNPPVCIYCTLTHIKFCLIDNSNSKNKRSSSFYSGVIKVLDIPIYLIHISNNVLHYIDREQQTQNLNIEPCEYYFKQAMLSGDYIAALQAMKTSNLIGQSIISWLKEGGFPDAALRFVQDPKIKFALAIESGDLSQALACCKILNENKYWSALGKEALQQGNHMIVEMAFQKTHNFEQLSFLYLLTGNMVKLSKMMQIAALRSDSMGRMHNALFLGDVEERVKILRENGSLKLAYITALNNDLTEIAESIASELGEEEIPKINLSKDAKLFKPPTPVIVHSNNTDSNWPLIEKRSILDNVTSINESFDHAEEWLASHPGGYKPDSEEYFDTNIEIKDDDETIDSSVNINTNFIEDSGWGNFDMDIPNIPIEKNDTILCPNAGIEIETQWIQNSNNLTDGPLITDLISANEFSRAFSLLKSKYHIVNVDELLPVCWIIYSACRPILTNPLNLTLKHPFSRNEESKVGSTLPSTPFSLNYCSNKLKMAYKLVTEGQLPAAIDAFRQILHVLPFVITNNFNEVNEINTFIRVCSEYIISLKLEIERRECKDTKRQCELACYFCVRDLQPIHNFLGLRVAVKTNYTQKNFKTAAFFCHKILELISTCKLPPQLAESSNQIRGVLAACEKNRDDAISLNFDSRANNVITPLCSLSLSPITPITEPPTPTNPSYSCYFCKSEYSSAAVGQTCSICKLTIIE